MPKKNNVQTQNLTGWIAMKAQSVFLMSCVGVLLSTTACTTVKGALTRACDVAKIPLNTGFDHLAEGLDPQTLDPGDSDPKWIVIADPNPTTIEPRPATVVRPHTAWEDPLPNSRWIGAYPAGTEDAVNIASASRARPYSYLSCFCLCDESRLEFAVFQDVSLRADNEVTVLLNDQEVLVVTQDDTFGSDPVELSVDSDLFRPGINCLQVNVLNGSGPSGFNLSGLWVKTSCCEGQISRPEPTPDVPDPLTRPAGLPF